MRDPGEMPLGGCVIAIAIEDSVDLLVRDGAGEGAVDYEFSKAVPEGRDYLAEVYEILLEGVRQLARRLAPDASKGQVRDLFNSVDALGVSVPGVVAENRILVQIPLWHSASSEVALWQLHGTTEELFAFDEVLAQIVDLLITEDNDIWGARERRRFMSRVFVVNDTSACAAYEYHLRRTNVHVAKVSAVADFAYMKIHNGMNIGVLQLDKSGNVELKVNDAEAGHTFPMIHELDFKAGFRGVCRYHQSCYEGMVAGHSFYERTVKSKKGTPFADWKVELERFRQQGLQGTALDNALVRHVLGDREGRSDGTREGVDVLAHYAAQAGLHMSIGPLSVGQLVVGGQMATPGVIEAMRDKMVAWAHGYPQRRTLTKEGVRGHVVPSTEGPRRRVTVEAVGAQVIAFSRANVPIDELSRPVSSINLNLVPVPANVERL